jgi:carbon-monoxide dehydrogenase catalytic subunit
MGECLDNARAVGIFRALSDAAGTPLKQMPFAFVSPEWSNEKGIGAALAFRLLGIDSYHCVFGATLGSDQVQHFLEHETRDLLGSAAVVETDPAQLAARIVDDLERRCKALEDGRFHLAIAAGPSAAPLRSPAHEKGQTPPEVR